MAKRAKTECTVTAENTFSGVLYFDKGERGSISVSGTFAATITLQRRLDGQNWRNIENYTLEVERDLIASENMELRIGCLTGNYTSGTAVARIGK